MKNLSLTLAAALVCGVFGMSVLVSCSKDDKAEATGYTRGLYSDVVPDDGSNGPMFSITEEDLKLRAEDLDIETATLKAVWKVESNGKSGFLPSLRPVILFEGHIFWQQLKAEGLNPKDYVKGNEDILYQKLDKTKYVGGEDEWSRLDRAAEIHEDAAYRSASYGMFQTMGYLYDKCSCETVQAFVEKMSASQLSQLDLFVNFLKSNPTMLKALHDRDWKTFAKLYNGPAYAQNRYDEKLSKAYSAAKKEESEN